MIIKRKTVYFCNDFAYHQFINSLSLLIIPFC